MVSIRRRTPDPGEVPGPVLDHAHSACIRIPHPGLRAVQATPALEAIPNDAEPALVVSVADRDYSHVHIAVVEETTRLILFKLSKVRVGPPESVLS